MKKWLIENFELLQGMYFDNILFEKDLIYFSSDTLDDSEWNYGMLYEITHDSLSRFIEFCTNHKKLCNLYIHSEDVKKHKELLQTMGFSTPETDKDIIVDRWCDFQKMKYSKKEISSDVQLVCTDQQKQDFINVFISAFGEDVTPQNPYGGFSPEFINSVKRSFNFNKFFHYICYFQGEPASIASLCMSGSMGGLFNVGTDPRFERKGLGFAVVNASIDQWQKIGGTKLFGQTDANDTIDKWYEKMGFEPVFDAVICEKEI